MRIIPTSDRAWLTTALVDALAGGDPVCPVAPDAPEELLRQLRALELQADTALVIHTSGSSGMPKSVELSAAALTASANATHARLGGPGRWIVALPLQLISGVQQLVRSHLAGEQPVFAASPHACEIVQAVQESRSKVNYLSVVPVQLARLLDMAAADREAADALRSLAAILVGGQAVPLQLRAAAHELGLRLVRTYGSSETAGGCVYDGVELDGVDVRIRAGEVQLAGPQLATGYAGNPELTASRFITDNGTRWYRTGDSGELLGGMLTVTGRLDRVLISGGVNVSLDRVEGVLRELAGWESAVAVALPDEEWGQRVAVVRETGAGANGAEGSISQTDAVARVRAELGAAATPADVLELEQLPRLAGGKVDLQQLEKLVQQRLA